jgi:hypothetical protein
MFKSKYFWAASILWAIIPWFLIDISEHVAAFKKEVREEFTLVAQDV